jgi:hypothetical protein
MEVTPMTDVMSEMMSDVEPTEDPTPQLGRLILMLVAECKDTTAGMLEVLLAMLRDVTD